MNDYTELKETVADIIIRQAFCELNDNKTRDAVRVSVVHYVRKNYNFYSVLFIDDETVNTPSVVDNNSFALDMYFRETEESPFRKFSWVLTTTGVKIEVVVGEM